MKFKKLLFIIVCSLMPTCVLAKPCVLTAAALTTPVSPVDKVSSFYQFERFSLSSDDQQRHYQVTLGIPNGPMPKQGYPVLYMLDGNAALSALTEERFAHLQGADWPVIVTVGYEADARTARVYDYTPPVTNNTVLTEGPQFGGAEQFWQFIEQELKPQVAQRVKVDMERQSLWGHSFGGLFVLHTLFNHPTSFQNYIAADPSLWWQQGQILEAEAAYRLRVERPLGQVLIQSSSSQREGSTLADDAIRRLAQRLSQLPELTVQYYDYFQHHHGSVRAASIPAALRMAQGIEQQ